MCVCAVVGAGRGSIGVCNVPPEPISSISGGGASGYSRVPQGTVLDPVGSRRALISLHDLLV